MKKKSIWEGTSTTGTATKALTMDDLKKTVEMLEANVRLATPPFIPKLWSKKLVEKFYDSTLFPKITQIDPIREITAEIKRLSESGLTPEQIAEKIDPDKFFDVGTFMPWKSYEEF